MPATSVEEKTQAEEVVDDLSATEVPAEAVDLSKLAALKAKQQAKQNEEKMSARIVAKKERSLNFGVIGSGQAGSRLAEAFYKLGYDTVIMNTTNQDLKFISVPDSNKLLLENGIGGSAKELSLGASVASEHRGEILQLINEKLSSSQVNVLCFSLGGGSGAGSSEVLIDVLASLGKPIVVITILPMDSDDSQTKSNALETLSKLAGFTRSKKISNLIVVDNAKIESIFQSASQFDFFDLANKSIVETLDTFNSLSCQPSAIKAMDCMEFSKILMDGEGLSIYGEMEVENYEEDTSIAECVVNNLSGNLLANGFDLKTSKYVGFLICASKETWAKIPASSVNYASAMVSDICGSPKGIFKGIYTVEGCKNVKVYSFFSGLGLPTERIEALKKETLELQSKIKGTEENRNLTLQLDTGKNETISQAQAIKNKMAAKSSTFGKFVNGTTSDRRK